MKTFSFKPLKVYINENNSFFFTKNYFKMIKKAGVKKHYNKIKEFIHKRRKAKFNKIKNKNNIKTKLRLFRYKQYKLI